MNKTKIATKMKTTLRLYFNSKIVFKFFTIYRMYLHLCHIYIYIYIYRKNIQDFQNLKISHLNNIHPNLQGQQGNTCLYHNVQLQSLDSDFSLIAKHTPFTLFLSANCTVTYCSQPSVRLRFHLISIILLTPIYG